jgi:hypothetical protein
VTEAIVLIRARENEGAGATAAVVGRNQSSAHKRLILLATLSLTPAAFNRAIGRPFLHPLLGNGVWETYVQIYAATGLMVLGIGIYDLLTRDVSIPLGLSALCGFSLAN